jgi:hypothetical protein
MLLSGWRTQPLALALLYINEVLENALDFVGGAGHLDRYFWILPYAYRRLSAGGDRMHRRCDYAEHSKHLNPCDEGYNKGSLTFLL